MRPDGLGPPLVCGVPDVDAQTAELVDEYSTRMATRVSAQLTASQTIPVYWHVIEDGRGGGEVSGQQIADQLTVLNAAYGAAGFSFSLVGTTNVGNAAWYHATHGSTAVVEMTRALRRGGSNTLKHLQ